MRTTAKREILTCGVGGSFMVETYFGCRVIRVALEDFRPYVWFEYDSRRPPWQRMFWLQVDGVDHGHMPDDAQYVGSFRDPSVSAEPPMLYHVYTERNRGNCG